MELKGKKILVTGGGGVGVGGGICQALVNFGATIVLNEINLEKAQEAAEKYPKAIPVAADIGDSEQVSVMFEHIAKEIGVLDGLVNNAGVGLSTVAHEASEEEFNRLYDIDIKGVWQQVIEIDIGLPTGEQREQCIRVFVLTTGNNQKTQP